MAALEPCYFKPNIYSKLRNDSIEDSEVKSRLEKNFADLVKGAKSVEGFCPCRQCRVGPNDVT